MQEDIENKSVMLLINGSKLTARKLAQAAAKLLSCMKKKNTKNVDKDVTKHGKQSVKQLLKKDAGATSIELNDPNLKDFERVARKYGVDYAVRQVKGDKPKFMVFFKARDNDAITAMLTEIANKRMKQQNRPSIRKLLQSLKNAIVDRNPVRNKDKERSR